MTPNSALIHGVPFVSWGEAPDLEFSEGVNTDPSRPACVHMIAKYWTPELYQADQDSRTFTFPEELDTWQTDKGNAKSIDDIKQSLANGYPVFVFSGATPVGHYWGMPFLYLSGPFAAKDLSPRSDILGFIAPYEMFKATDNLRMLHEVVCLTDRVVIGYNDDEQIVFLHDPSFGPAWEISYDEFDQMWEPYDRGYSILYPPDAAARLENRSKGFPYRKHSTDERAAYHYVFGYALACAGDQDGAKKHYYQGLKLPDLSNGYRHLFCVELAVQVMIDGDVSEAGELLQEALSLVPYHYLPCQMIKRLFAINPDIKGRLLNNWRSWIARWPASYKKLRDVLPKNIPITPNGMKFMGLDPASNDMPADINIKE